MATVERAKIPVIVFYEGMPSYNQISREFRFLGSREVIRDQVIRSMKEKAESLHFWLKQHCQSRSLANEVSNFSSSWIANTVSLEATPNAIREIANQPNIKKIIWNKTVPMLLNQERGMDWGVAKIGADKAWKYYEGRGVTVAVIDTGVNEHGDLEGRVIDGSNYVTPGTPPRDDHGHGTHCAGSVAGDGKMGTKTGVAPQAKIVSIKVLGKSGGGKWDKLWKAIEETIDRKVRVLSMSLGGNPNDQEIRDRLRRACKTAIAAGIVPVIAAGNSGPSKETVGSPGDVPEVITVGATDSKDKIAYFSSRGPVKWDGKELTKPDVCAPGVNINSCSHTSNGYTKKSGTSMATPHVAGVVALMLNARPKLTPVIVKQLLETTAVKLSDKKDNTFGSGRVDVPNLLEKLQQARDGRWEMVVKELSFEIQVDENGNIEVTKDIENELMPATVTIWVDVKEDIGRKGIYKVKFSLTGPDGKTTTGKAKIDYDVTPQNSDQYDEKYGYNVGNFDLLKGAYKGSVKSEEPNTKVCNKKITFVGKATWPARAAKPDQK